MKILYGVNLNIRHDELYETCEYVRNIGKWSISPFRPIGGDLAFGYDSDTRMNENRSQRAPFLPEFIGHSYKTILNNKTGPAGIRIRLKELGKKADESQVNSILSKVKETYEKKKKLITDKQFKKIVEETLGLYDN